MKRRSRALRLSGDWLPSRINARSDCRVQSASGMIGRPLTRIPYSYVPPTGFLLLCVRQLEAKKSRAALKRTACKLNPRAVAKNSLPEYYSVQPREAQKRDRPAA